MINMGVRGLSEAGTWNVGDATVAIFIGLCHKVEHSVSR